MPTRDTDCVDLIRQTNNALLHWVRSLPHFYRNLFVILVRGEHFFLVIGPRCEHFDILNFNIFSLNNRGRRLNSRGRRLDNEGRSLNGIWPSSWFRDTLRVNDFVNPHKEDSASDNPFPCMLSWIFFNQSPRRGMPKVCYVGFFIILHFFKCFTLRIDVIIYHAVSESSIGIHIFHPNKGSTITMEVCVVGPNKKVAVSWVIFSV